MSETAPSLTLHGAADLIVTIRATRDAITVMLQELQLDETDVHVMAALTCMSALQAVYRDSVTRSMHAEVLCIVGEDAP